MLSSKGLYPPPQVPRQPRTSPEQSLSLTIQEELQELKGSPQLLRAKQRKPGETVCR